MELTLAMDNSPQVIKIDEVHSIAGRCHSGRKECSRGVQAQVRPHGTSRSPKVRVKCTRLAECCIEGMGKVGLVPLR
jgi:hypothetical protein